MTNTLCLLSPHSVLNDSVWESMTRDEKSEWVDRLKKRGSEGRHTMSGAKATLHRALWDNQLGYPAYPMDRVESRYLADFFIRKVGLVIDVAPKKHVGHIVVFLRKHGYAYLLLSEKAIETDLAGCVARIKRIVQRKTAERAIRQR